MKTGPRASQGHMLVGPKYVGHLPLASQAHYLEARLGIELLRFKQAPAWDAGAHMKALLTLPHSRPLSGALTLQGFAELKPQCRSGLCSLHPK